MSKKATNPFGNNQYITKKVNGRKVARFRLNESPISYWVKNVLAVAFVSFALVNILPIAPAVFADTLGEEKTEVIVRTVTVHEVEGDKIAEMQNEAISELAACETGTVKEPDAALIFDSNSEASVGRYQFQRSTVQLYSEELYGKKVSRAEAIEIAVDPERATELVRDILFSGEVDTREAVGNWYNCARKIGLEQKVEWIRKFMD